MQTPLNASAYNAGTLLSANTFEVPKFQREYSWGEGEVEEFWTDLSNNISSDSYFLGLVILTDEGKRKHVVDGQQRLITISLLAAALFHEAKGRDRDALADRISANFLKSIDFETDKMEARVRLSDIADNATFQHILTTGEIPSRVHDDSVSERIARSFLYLQSHLRNDLKKDPFKRLGAWMDFLSYRVYFAVFLHPDPSTAYQVFEVINTRGKELTTADLLKNYILSQTPSDKIDMRYRQWQSISAAFDTEGTNNFVQYIRHVVTVEDGHVLPKDLFSFLAGRMRGQEGSPHTPSELMKMLDRRLGIYLQMIDPTFAGPADPEMLPIFSALNSLGVIAVRPMLLAISEVPDRIEGMKHVLRLVVRRIVVGNLGTGNVERRFGEAAKKIKDLNDWRVIIHDLRDLNPDRRSFAEQVKKRSFNKNVLTFLRRSVIQDTVTPENVGTLHYICPRRAKNWDGMTEEDRAFWFSTIGNTFLSEMVRRPQGSETWQGFKDTVLQTGVAGELDEAIDHFDDWDVAALETVAETLAEVAANVWY